MYPYCSEKDGVILSVGMISKYDPQNPGYVSQGRYEQLLEAFRSKPAPEEGFDYRLREDLTWERYELPEPEEMEAMK